MFEILQIQREVRRTAVLLPPARRKWFAHRPPVADRGRHPQEPCAGRRYGRSSPLLRAEGRSRVWGLPPPWRPHPWV